MHDLSPTLYKRLKKIEEYQKSVNINEKNPTTDAIVSVCSTQTPSARPDLFKLNVDCFECIFEWMSLTELLTFRQTCKRMSQVVNYYIQLKYPKTTRLSLYNDRLLSKCCYTRLDYFEWIKHLYIATYRLSASQIESIKYMLSEIETLKLSWSEINGDLHDALLQHCPRLKYLGIGTCTLPEAIIGTGNNWMLRHYPQLQHFELENEWIYNTDEAFRTDELLTFFRKNPNIRIFSTDSALILKIGQKMIGTKINFDRLDIHMKDFKPDNFDAICVLLKDLHKQGIYDKLHLYIKHDCHYWDHDHTQHLWSIPNLEKLYLHAAYLLPNGFPQIHVDTITTLSIRFGFCESNSLQLMAENFGNLSSVEVQYAELNDIVPFICLSPKLQRLQVRKFYVNDAKEIQISDIIALDEERRKLKRARKVTIFINEASFLKLKWASKLNCSHIELKPLESCEVDHEFYWSWWDEKMREYFQFILGFY